MVEQGGFDFDPNVHRQPPPVVPIREGLAQAPQQPTPRPAPVPPPQQRLFTAPQPDVTPAYVTMARQLSMILATRVLLLISVITSSAIWGFAVVEPDPVRTVAATAFSAAVLWPLCILYLKKG